MTTATRGKPEPKPSAAKLKAATSTPATPARKTKIGGVIALLERNQGATLEEMIKATGCLPHTTRAALTGLKKKGHTIERDNRCKLTCYRITASA